MEAHSNYANMMGQCASKQKDFDANFDKWEAEGIDSDELSLRRKEKDINLKHIKFVDTVCNRIAYHISMSQ